VPLLARILAPIPEKERPRHVTGGAKLSFMQQPAKEGQRDRAYPLPTQDVTAAEHQKSPAVAGAIMAARWQKSRAMSNSGAATLGDVADRLPMLEVTCSKCERRGRLRTASLIAQHGADMRLPDLREILAGVCPRARSASVLDRCGAISVLPAVETPFRVSVDSAGRLRLAISSLPLLAHASSGGSFQWGVVRSG
jgi:hypothetical protein